MTIHFICHVNDQTPSGGVRKLYQHVDILNEAGIPAAVVQGKRGFSPTWFDHDTEIAYTPRHLDVSDVLVLPEWLNADLNRIAPGVPKISLNQNAYYSWHWLPFGVTHPYTNCSDLLGLVAVSQDNVELLGYSFPDIRIERVRYGFDPNIWHPSDDHRKRIAYMPRKRRNEASQVLAIMSARGCLEGWDVLAIEGMTETEVATALRESALFLSFNDKEGFGMPPVEALASGCFVIGFTGLGGREYFRPPYSMEVPEADVAGYARAVEQWLASYDHAYEKEQRHLRHEFVMAEYSPKIERESVVSAYSNLLARSAPGRNTTLRDKDTVLSHEWPSPFLKKLARKARRTLRS